MAILVVVLDTEPKVDEEDGVTPPPVARQQVSRLDI